MIKKRRREIQQKVMEMQLRKRKPGMPRELSDPSWIEGSRRSASSQSKHRSLPAMQTMFRQNDSMKIQTCM